MKEVDTLEKIAREVSICTKCKLNLGRHQAVPGEGSSKSELFFIGEGPGRSEDAEGRPFVGAAGKFLEEMLKNIGYKRGEVFIGNVVKCRPPSNRDPEDKEIAVCSNYLYRQLKIVNPKLIVTLGRFSLNLFLPNAAISKMHGQLKKIRFLNKKHPLYPLQEIFLFPHYHPAAGLYRGGLKTIIEQDFNKIPQALKKIIITKTSSARNQNSGQTMKKLI